MESLRDITLRCFVIYNNPKRSLELYLTVHDPDLKDAISRHFKSLQFSKLFALAKDELTQEEKIVLTVLLKYKVQNTHEQAFFNPCFPGIMKIEARIILSDPGPFDMSAYKLSQVIIFNCEEFLILNILSWFDDLPEKPECLQLEFHQYLHICGRTLCTLPLSAAYPPIAVTHASDQIVGAILEARVP
ncbi:Translation initiation factor IF-2 [Frankliniella fusca]|uniref:Translation initiation factor IF-2 n=1 Tax=Frankliniella fusca TaxID=407009 RepID=A0AAE1I162_9NEOP|nr:Translation initiation factor IF-2 [Frankliniella fusca]